MKNLVIFAIAIVITMNCTAQKDTSTIRLGGKKIIIVEDKDKMDKEIGDLNKGKGDFNRNMAENNDKIAKLNDSIAKLNSQKATANEATKAELDKSISDIENKISEINKENEAFQKGIKQIDDEIADMQDELQNNMGKGSNGRHKKHSDDNEYSKWHSHKKFNGHWAGFEIGMNNFMNKNYKMDLPTAADGIDGQFMELNASRSINYTLNFLEYSLPLPGEMAGFVTGMGVTWNNYNFKKNIDLVENANGVMYGQMISTDVKKYDKNTLNTIFLNVPIIFEVQLPVGSKQLHISAGVIGGVKVSSKTKQFYEINGQEKKEKVSGEYQLNPFRYEATFRIGYRFIDLFANYSFTPLFKNNKGPEVHPFTIGITLLDF